MLNRRSIVFGSLLLPVAAQAQGPNPGSPWDFLANVGDRCFFRFDRYDLNDEARQQAQSQVDWLLKYPKFVITIEGHCDERGTREYNLYLGERRATTVKQYYIDHGIEKNRIRTVSYGKERPAVIGSNEAAWSQNRRVVTVLT